MERKNTRFRPGIDKEKLEQLWAQVFSPEAQSVLSELCAAAKDEHVRAFLNARSERPRLRTLLGDDRPKVRKNAARLLGALFLPGDFPALKDALLAEQTKFVLPSIVLALGNAGEVAAEALSNYANALPVEVPPEDEKHHAELKEALNLALSRCQKRVRRAFTGLKAPAEIVLTTSSGCEPLLMAEAAERGIELKKTPNGLAVKGMEYKGLFQLRTFDEALFPLGRIPGPKKDYAAWAKSAGRAAQQFAGLLATCLSGEGPYPYRIELRGEVGDRKAAIRALSNLLDETGELANAPSEYDAEFRAVCEGNTTHLFAKLFVPTDPRFAYRTGAVSASIHPVNAAALMRFAKPHLKSGARVIDPCCGSGTLLVERAKLSVGVSDLLGVDVDGAALDIARKNTEAARVKAGFVRIDSTRFSPKTPFDELFANLPFGTRVGTAERNAAFYRALVQRLDKLLTPSGVAVFYTTQFAPLSRLLESAGWKIVDSMRFEAGGLSPFGVIAKRK